MAAIGTTVPQSRDGGGGLPVVNQLELAAANGAIASVAGGLVLITKAGVCALTLAAPYCDGCRITVMAGTANAHTVTVAGGINGTTTSGDVGTFGGAVSDGFEAFSSAGVWWLIDKTNVTFA